MSQGMNTIKHIIFDEWRYWHRSRVASVVIIIGLVLTLASVVVNSISMQAAAHQRAHQQVASEAQFLAQPDRHPHRMVHYGHYVFRTPTPLSMLEPGVDAYTGHTMFLEGHRQNSAMFADQKQSSGLTQFSSVSPAFMLQVLAPLLLIMVGYASVTREREAGTLTMMLTQGVKPQHILLGKWLALVGSGLLLLIPLVVASVWAISIGESPMISLGFVLGYCAYLIIWSALVVWVSSISQLGSASFVGLIVLWILFCILIPRISSATATALAPSAGKLESDFAMLVEKQKLGDSHNASDPVFKALKANLLAKYQVDDVADLPFNFKGYIAANGEQKLADLLNKFAEARMQQTLAQSELARQFGWLSPTMAVRSFSMMLAGTNLENHHRFLREAEAVRIDFVQALNKLQETALDYQTDTNKYRDAAAQKASRIDASNWRLLNDFSFEVAPARQRLQQSLVFALQLGFWSLLMLILLRHASRRIA